MLTIHSVTRVRTWLGIITLVVYAFLIVMLISIFLSSSAIIKDESMTSAVVSSTLAAILVCLGVHKLLQTRWLKQRARYIDEFRNSQGYGGLAEALSIGRAGSVSFSNSLDILPGKEKHHDNVIVGDDWIYSDYSYGVFKKTKHGEYRVATVHYAVISTKLPRRLPNVLFDSKVAHGRQFRLALKRSQRHSLEGDFDNYFATYFPNKYKIDSLSFITPEVMLAMRDAADYDIEIKDDQLIIFGPLLKAETQIPEMSFKLMRIRKKLMNNIATYRDERLPYAQGRQLVGPLGISLLKSRTRFFISILVVVLYFIFRIVFDILS